MDGDNEVPQRETEVNKVLGNLRKAVEVLTKLVDETEARLKEVVRIGPVAISKDKSVEPMYKTSLAQEINKSHDNVMFLRDRLENLIDRLEL